MVKIKNTYVFLILIFAINSLAVEYSFLRNPVSRVICQFRNDTSINKQLSFIIPNEFRTNQYGEVLEKIEGNTMVSVGSLRSFIIFGLGNFTYGIFADLEQNIVDFNKAVLDLMIALSNLGLSVPHQRYQFLSLLSSGTQLNEQELAEIDKATDVETEKVLRIIELTKDRHKKALALALNENVRKIINDITKILKNFKVLFYDSWLSQFYSEQNSEKSKSDALYLARNEKYKFFWESDEQWLKIVDAAKNDRIAVITRNVADPMFYEELDTCFTTLDARLGLLDYSNIPAGSQYLTEHDKKTMTNIMEKLIKPSSSFMFITHNKDYSFYGLEYITKQATGIHWRYYYFNLSNIGLLQNL